MMETTAQPRIDGALTGAAGGELSPEQTWVRVFDRVRREVDVATVWLAMQAVKPLGIDGSYFVVTLPPESRYLATNLLSHEYAIPIEEALHEVTGRVLAFHLIEGDTLEDWQAEKARDAVKLEAARSATKPAAPHAAPQAPPTAPHAAPTAPEEHRPLSRETLASWERLNDKLIHGYKGAPLIKYAQGQARYLLECVQAISDTIDVLMPGPGPHDPEQERHLARTIERLGNVMGNLDPLFIALELLRYRQSQGKDIGLPQ